jgi:DNA-binding transcriptional regulator GbsR (MarR family)
MNIDQAKQEFVQTWGKLGGEWGINRTMAQLHALLLVSEPLNTDEIMAQLKISRGNAHMNLKALMEWGLISKEIRSGVRSEYFSAEKDVWEVARTIAIQRRKRELDPLMKALERLLEVDESKKGSERETREFKKLVQDILSLGKKSNTLLDLVLKLDQVSFFKPILQLIRR